MVVLNKEDTDYKWCSFDEALTLASFPNQHAVFQHVWSHFVQWPVSALYRANVCQLLKKERFVRFFIAFK